MKRVKSVRWAALAVFIAAPLFGQGLTLTMKETSPTGQTAPTLQMDPTHARLDIPSLASQVLYDSVTKTVRVLVPLLKLYREYAPATVQQRASADAANGRGRPALAPITYKRTGSSKLGEWPCTTYDGFRGADKVVEVCAAEGNAIGLTAADFVLAQQAIDVVKAIAQPELIERIPVYGDVRSQGFAGFPVRRVSFRNGMPDVTTELVEIRRGAVPLANFEVPAGYNKAP
jgi:hypothetical protein